MADKPKRETVTVDDIVAYHTDVIDSLRSFLNSLYEHGDKRFLGYSLSQYQVEIRGRIDETDLRSSLALLTAVEAALSEDFLLRVEEPGHDPLSISFIELNRRRANRVRFDELLELWRQHHPELHQIVAKLRAAAHYRHWLAHGRYWQRPKNGNFDFASLYDLALAALHNFPLLKF